MSIGNPVRVGGSYKMGNDTADIVYPNDIVIRVSDAGKPPSLADYVAVCGQTKGEAVPGRAQYCDDGPEILAQGGWVYITGSWPRGRTRRVRAKGNGTTILVRLMPPPAGADPEIASEHRAYFLATYQSQYVDLTLVDDPTEWIRIRCDGSASPPALPDDPAVVLFVEPGQECYLPVGASDKVLDPATVVYEPEYPAGSGKYSWTGTSEAAFIADVYLRVAKVIKP